MTKIEREEQYLWATKSKKYKSNYFVALNELYDKSEKSERQQDKDENMGMETILNGYF